MKRFFNYLHQGLLVLALVAIAFMACDSGEEEPGGGQNPTELPELADLVGRWGITETNSDGSTQTLVPCENTLQVESNGDFTYIDVARGDWLEGNMAFDASDSSLTLTVDGQTINLKLLSIADGSFTLQSEDNDGGSVTISTQIFTALESADCPSFTNAELTDKWSIQGFTRELYELGGEGDDIGTLSGTETQDNLTENTFTIEFRSDGSVLTIDYVNEYDYQLGTFRNIDNHNLILTFPQEGGEERDDCGAFKSEEW